MDTDKDRGRSYIDVLTGVLNREYLQVEGEKEISSLISANTPFSLVIIDIDHFKEINDTHGHNRGDQVLKQFGSFLLAALRVSDRVIRYGGDEFVCLMPNTLRNNAESIYLRILKRLKGMEFDGLPITVSVGIASFPGDGADYKNLFDAADKALYEAKRQGRDRVAVTGEKQALLPIRIFIDRRQECDAIKGFISGEKKIRLVVINGNAGIGKTRLSKEVLNDVRGREILWCDCMYFTEHVAYYPVREIIKCRLRRSGRDWLASIPAVYRIELGKLVPELAEGGSAPGSEAVLDKYRLYESVRRVIDVDAREKLIVVDNAQWIDDASLEVLKYLMRALRDNPVSFFFLCRTEEMTPELDNFLSFTSREVVTREVALAAFKSGEVRDAIRAILGDQPSEPLFDYVTRGSGGNPFYIEEIVRMLIEGRHLKFEENEWRFSEPAGELLPRTLADIVARNYRLLNPEAQSVLDIASVVGWFDVSIIGALTGKSELQVMGQINELNRLGLVKFANDRFQFSEAVSRQVIYKKFVAGPKGKDLHRRIADELENRYRGREREIIEDLATHSYQAGDRQRGIRYCEQAAAAAQEKYANKSVINYFSWALDLFGEPPDQEESGLKVDCLLKRTEVFRRIGDLKSADRDLESAQAEASRFDDLKRQAEVKAAKSLLLMAGARYDMAVREAEASMALMQRSGNEDAVPRVLIALGTIYLTICDYGKAFDAFGRAYATIAGRGPRDSMLAHAANGMGIVLYKLGKYNEAMREYQEALSIDRQGGSRVAEACVLNNMANIQVVVGNYRQALKLYEDALAVFQQAGDRKNEALSRTNICNSYVRFGDYSRAVQYNEPALEIALAMGDAYLELLARIDFSAISAAKGEFEEALAGFEAIAKKADAVKLDFISFEARINMATIYIDTGRPAAARTIIDSIRAGSADLRDRQILLLPVLARLQAGEGKIEEFNRTAAELEQLFAGAVPPNINSEMIQNHAASFARQGDFARAEQYYRTALTIFNSGGEKPRVARVYMEVGELARLRRDRDRARENFEQARKIYAEIGARGWVKDAEARLAGLDTGAESDYN